jgi:hypothetical protein
MNGKWTMVALIAGFISASQTAWAQPAPAPAATTEATMPAQRMHLGADADVAVPLGNFSDGAGIGLGALLRYEQAMLPNLNLTGRLGFIYHLPKTQVVPGFSADTKFWTIPVLAGVKFALNQSFYAAGELGLFFNHASVDVSGGGFGSGSSSSTETDVGVTLGGGYRTGDLDIRAGLHILDLGHAGDSMAIALNVGYNFWAQ